MSASGSSYRNRHVAGEKNECGSTFWLHRCPAIIKHAEKCFAQPTFIKVGWWSTKSCLVFIIQVALCKAVVINIMHILSRALVLEQFFYSFCFSLQFRARDLCLLNFFTFFKSTRKSIQCNPLSMKAYNL